MFAASSDFLMSRNVQPQSVELYFLPVETRVPLKFGPETLTNV